LMQDCAQLNIGHVRLTRDPFVLNLKLVSGRLLYRACHALIFSSLSAWGRPKVERRRLKHTRRVFGLLQNGQVNEIYVSRLLEYLPEGDSELYSHPSLDDFKDEFEALISPRVCGQIKALGIELIRYQDL
jgi:hypothetical protein